MTEKIHLIDPELMQAIRSFPIERQMNHCGLEFTVSPFAIYAACPKCGVKMKLRSLTACCEIPDIFEAVFQWLERPGAQELARKAVQDLREEP